MSLKIVIDMNLSPDWVEVFKGRGLDALHWSTVGDPRAADRIIMDWARTNHYIVFTNDLDFGTLLAVTQAKGPSVIQVRAQAVLPDRLSSTILAALNQYRILLEEGALIVVDESSARARILPLQLS
jgi:predicted nuclease of predicted toxin-antitoxin system